MINFILLGMAFLLFQCTAIASDRHEVDGWVRLLPKSNGNEGFEVDVVIGGKYREFLVFDTGASTTVISHQTAKGLGLSCELGRVSTVSGEYDICFSSVDKLTISGMTFYDVSVAFRQDPPKVQSLGGYKRYADYSLLGMSIIQHLRVKFINGNMYIRKY